MFSFFRTLYFSLRLFFVALAFILLFTLAYFLPLLFIVVKVLFAIYLVAILADILLLYVLGNKILANRIVAEKLSNGDENEVEIKITNNYPLAIDVNVIDESPEQFQYRKMDIKTRLQPKETKNLIYNLKPTKRGVYSFGYLHVFAKTFLGFIERRYSFTAETEVAVYPSYIQMQKYEFLAISNRLTLSGIKKIRRIGQNFEFEQIRNYVQGDDFRTVNWNATARSNELMVNQYTDEKSQQVYCVIDKGRVMRMPFNEFSLLDYSINASLALSNIAIKKYDKAGIITMTEEGTKILAAERKPDQMKRINNMLYAQKTRYLEIDFDKSYMEIKKHIRQRSLLLFFTNFETLSSLKRHLPYYRALAKYHLVVVIFFENTELEKLANEKAENLEDIFTNTIAEKMVYDKKLIVAELLKYGIQSVLTAPENLTVNTINKYLELKARGWI